MKYNFDEIIERRGTNSYKWDLVKEDGVIPMWVADMDFQTAPCIIEALQKRVAHGICNCIWYAGHPLWYNAQRLI